MKQAGTHWSNLNVALALAVVIAWAVSGCGSEPPETLTLSNAAPNRPSSPFEVEEPADLLRAIITVCKEDLHLPVVDPLKIVLHKNTRSFAAAAYGPAGVPMDIPSTLAFTKRDEIHVNLEKLTERLGWITLMSTLSHEYAHLIEREITPNRYLGMLWFSEGFAEWVAARVLHSLKLQDYAITLHHAEEELKHGRADLPKLASLTVEPNWKYISNKAGGRLGTYRLAFVAVDRLIRKKGIPAVLEYFKSGSFESSFALSWDKFAADFDRSIVERSYATGGAIFEKPVWMRGTRWRYIVEEAGERLEIVKEVVGEESFGGVPAYVVKNGDRYMYYAKETLARLGATKDGKAEPPPRRREEFLWPLAVGKEWRDEVNSFAYTAAEIETIAVPAGKFQALRIGLYTLKGGHLAAEYWYSPQVKWLVKERLYSLEAGPQETELAEFVAR